LPKHKVLIVDDDPQIRKILTRMLQGPKFEIHHAEDGQQALDVVSDVEPHLIILDIMMPGMSGIDVCRQVREKYPERDIKVLMLSAKDSQSDRRLALEYGANDYVTKPFHIASLGRKIEYMFEKGESDLVAESI